MGGVGGLTWGAVDVFFRGFRAARCCREDGLSVRQGEEDVNEAVCDSFGLSCLCRGKKLCGSNFLSFYLSASLCLSLKVFPPLRLSPSVS